jgi:hypothetical protein
MDNFNLKLFLVENKLTETSRLNEIKVVPGKISKKYYAIINYGRDEKHYDGHPMHIITNSKSTMINKLNLSLKGYNYELSDLDDDNIVFDHYINDDWAVVTSDLKTFKEDLSSINYYDDRKEVKKFPL